MAYLETEALILKNTAQQRYQEQQNLQQMSSY